MRRQGDFVFMRNEMIFAKELWKLILEAEELVRNHYLELAEQEIHDLYDESDNPEPS